MDPPAASMDYQPGTLWKLFRQIFSSSLVLRVARQMSLLGISLVESISSPTVFSPAASVANSSVPLGISSLRSQSSMRKSGKARVSQVTKFSSFMLMQSRVSSSRRVVYKPNHSFCARVVSSEQRCGLSLCLSRNSLKMNSLRMVRTFQQLPLTIYYTCDSRDSQSQRYLTERNSLLYSCPISYEQPCSSRMSRLISSTKPITFLPIQSSLVKRAWQSLAGSRYLQILIFSQVLCRQPKWFFSLLFCLFNAPQKQTLNLRLSCGSTRSTWASFLASSNISMEMTRQRKMYFFMLEIRPNSLSLTSRRMNSLMIMFLVWKYFLVRTNLLPSITESSLLRARKSPTYAIAKVKGRPATFGLVEPKKNERCDMSLDRDCISGLRASRKRRTFSALELMLGQKPHSVDSMRQWETRRKRSVRIMPLMRSSSRFYDSICSSCSLPIRCFSEPQSLMLPQKGSSSITRTSFRLSSFSLSGSGPNQSRDLKQSKRVGVEQKAILAYTDMGLSFNPNNCRTSGSYDNLGARAIWSKMRAVGCRQSYTVRVSSVELIFSYCFNCSKISLTKRTASLRQEALALLPATNSQAF